MESCQADGQRDSTRGQFIKLKEASIGDSPLQSVMIRTNNVEKVP